MVTCRSSELGWEVTLELPADFLSLGRGSCHVGSPHTGGLSPSGGSHQFDEFANGLHDNLSKMNLGCNSIVQSYTRLPTTEDLQFNLGDRFQPANVNFPLDYQPPRQNYPPNQMREDVAPQ